MPVRRAIAASVRIIDRIEMLAECVHVSNAGSAVKGLTIESGKKREPRGRDHAVLPGCARSRIAQRTSATSSSLDNSARSLPVIPSLLCRARRDRRRVSVAGQRMSVHASHATAFHTCASLIPHLHLLFVLVSHVHLAPPVARRAPTIPG